MTTVAPARPDLAELEQRATDRPGDVCHLIGEDGQVLCGALGRFALWPQYVDADPTSSPCPGGCGRNRCASCAAEYTIRRAAA